MLMSYAYTYNVFIELSTLLTYVCLMVLYVLLVLYCNNQYANHKAKKRLLTASKA